MSGITSATVETLTAEVRVLQVGNRQVTASVAKQLDQVDLAEMEPMGRIRLGDFVRIIGRRHLDGTLVTASSHARSPLNPWVNNLESHEVIRACRTIPISHDSDVGIQWGARVVMVPYKCLTFICEERPQPTYIRGQDELYEAWVERHGGMNARTPCSSSVLVSDGAAEALTRAVMEYDARVQLFQDANAMPLIVLAGLR